MNDFFEPTDTDIVRYVNTVKTDQPSLGALSEGSDGSLTHDDALAYWHSLSDDEQDDLILRASNIEVDKLDKVKAEALGVDHVRHEFRMVNGRLSYEPVVKTVYKPNDADMPD